MKFDFIAEPDIPRLAWCMKIQLNEPIVRVVHGSWVEVGEGFFIEGGWAGPFSEKSLQDSHALMGSGAVIVDNKLIVSAPCHTMECLYSLRQKDCLLFSNSIPFILASAEDDLDPNYLDYEGDIWSILDGLSNYKKIIPTKSGNVISLHYYCNISVDENLSLEELEKPAPPDFTDFNSYYNFLVSTLKQISQNLASVERKKTYAPIVFSSNGYDSTTCAALGREIGCSEAVCYESKDARRSDSGKEVVRLLGYTKIHEGDEADYKNFNTAEEFLASGELGTSVFFAASEKELEGKFQLSGFNGSMVWDREHQGADFDLVRHDYPDAAKKEFRLRVGFIILPVPFLGIMNRLQIRKISNSAEMLPWTLNNEYDRPIPRRILEERGIPRELFGFYKYGGTGNSLRFWNLAYLKKVMPQGSYLEFEEFYKKNKRRFSFKNIPRYLAYLIYCTDIYLTSKNLKRFINLGKILNMPNWDHKYKCSPWAPSMLFNWAVQKLIPKYRLGGVKLRLERCPLTFRFIKNLQIPKLAWCMKVVRGESKIEVVHGSWVEVGENFFVEGGWGGPFGEGNFHLSDSLMGSGAQIVDNELIVSTPCHDKECIYGIEKDGCLLFSNSIPFILVSGNDNLDPNYLEYESDILSISDGLTKYVKTIPTVKGNKIGLHYCCNLAVDNQLEVKVLAKPSNSPDFYCFADYYRFLVENLQQISENLSSRDRKVNYSPIVFSSNGYDSAVCAALGREIGCDEAVVYESKDPRRQDSGIDVIKCLGYKTIHERHELDYKNFNTAEEFLASGELGNGIFVVASEKELEGKFMLSGIKGDLIWDRNHDYIEFDPIRHTYPGTAHKEFRLRVGYIFVTVAGLGIDKHKQIFRISNSEEMLPWALHNDYDRPIPRRILEEKGVPRKLFGFYKHGGTGNSLRFLNLSFLKRVMPQGNYLEFAEFYKKNKRRFSVKYILRYLAYLIYCADIYLTGKNLKRFINFDKILNMPNWDYKYRCSPWAPSMLFYWAVQKLKVKYKGQQS